MVQGTFFKFSFMAYVFIIHKQKQKQKLQHFLIVIRGNRSKMIMRNLELCFVMAPIIATRKGEFQFADQISNPVHHSSQMSRQTILTSSHSL